MNRSSLGRSVLCMTAGSMIWRLAHGTETPAARMSRETLLKLGVAGAAALVTGIWKSRIPAFAAPSAVLSSAGTCALSPELTEGPYYIPGEAIRRNLVEHKPGTPLKLRFAVVDAATCKPIKGVAVDIWHCDARGIYAGFISASTGGPPGGGSGPTDKSTFLRGVQLTGPRGQCEFQTVYPGWYRGRTVHVHVKVHLGGTAVGHVVHTGQVFFPDTLTSKVYQSGIYRARAAARDTFNNGDSLYQSGGPQSTLALKPDGRGGYVGTITLAVHRS